VGVTPPDAPTHRGVLRVRELWLDRALLGEDEVRRRVARWWRPGASLRRLGDGVLLSLPSPVRVDCRTVGASPLLQGSSAPAPIRTGGWVWRGGAWVGGPLESLPAEDPSSWLDDALPAEVVATRPLGEPPPVTVAAAPVTLDLRRRLGLGDALYGLGSALPAAPPGVTEGLRSMFAGLLGGAARAGNALAGSSPLARSWLNRLQSMAEGLGLESLLAGAVGAHNARYLQELLSHLEGGDWMEALRRGIPLGGDGPSTGDLAWLSSLKGLQFSFGGGGGAGSSVGATPDVYERLRALYQRAFDALDAQGLRREAAYVLAELLGKVIEAVDYLERHGEYALAAELAESKKLDPGLVVTLWIRAGDEERAVALAVVREAFAVAVEQLERRGEHEVADGLRLRWAWREQRAGRTVAAVDVAWTVEAARPLVREWLARAVGAGGPGGARALARSLALRPEARETDLAALAAVLRDDTPAARAALAAALGDDPWSRRVLRATARALVLDAVGDPALDPTPARDAARRCQDGALDADLPPLPSRPPVGWPEARVHHAATAADTGLTPTFDAVPLARGRWLVAVGEAGAWVVDAQGRRLTTFAATCHRVVTTPDGSRQLLLGRRGDRWRVHLLAWPEGRVTRWIDLVADAFCAECDGSVWFVGRGGEVDALDLHAAGARSLWHVDGLGQVRALDWEPGHLRWVTSPRPNELERFHYALPSLQLRERKSTLHAAKGSVVATSAGFVVGADGALEMVVGTTSSRLETPAVRHVAGGGTRAAAVTRSAAELYEPDGLGFKPRAVVELTGAGAGWSRFVRPEDDVPCWIAGDDRGRLRVVDLRSGSLRLDLRV
jgi:hypothetical protein